jgi:hypothetical protein
MVGVGVIVKNGGCRIESEEWRVYLLRLKNEMLGVKRVIINLISGAILLFW